MSAAGMHRAPWAFWPDHNGEKSARPAFSAAARSGTSAFTAEGKTGGRSLSGPRSRMSRLKMPRAGRPVNRLVRAVCRAASDARAWRCNADQAAPGMEVRSEHLRRQQGAGQRSERSRTADRDRERTRLESRHRRLNDRHGQAQPIHEGQGGFAHDRVSCNPHTVKPCIAEAGGKSGSIRRSSVHTIVSHGCDNRTAPLITPTIE